MPTTLRTVAAVLTAAAVLTPAAEAATTCKSNDLRYPYTAGGPKTFGVFRLKITNGRCTTARSVARAWKNDFEAALKQGKVRLPRREGGFAFKTLPANAAQTYRERGTKGSTVIRFDYVVPNG